jgi:cell division protease FtsH
MTTGAKADIDRATTIARKMVCDWGMSEELGPLNFGRKEEQIFLGREIAQHRDYSEQTAVLIDKEVRHVVDEAGERATGLINKHIDQLKRLATTLLDREILDGEEIEKVLKGEDLGPPREWKNNKAEKMAGSVAGAEPAAAVAEEPVETGDTGAGEEEDEEDKA